DRMIVWGGFLSPTETTRTGGRYDPATDTWSPTLLSPNVATRAFHQAVWTGSIMVVWGGVSSFFTRSWPTVGERYDPVTDTWQQTTSSGAPVGREQFSAVWSGSEMVIQGGYGACVPIPQFPFFCAQAVLRTGGRYD